MLKLMFIPFRVLGGLLAGATAKSLFARVWALIDREQPPEPEQRIVSMPKLLAALALEGAIFRAVRGLVDHGAREAFRRTTGRWPGEQRAERQDVSSQPGA
jgi:hypothetical protein